MPVSVQRLEKSRSHRVYYPTSDGKPVGETEKHVNLIIDTISVPKYSLPTVLILRRGAQLPLLGGGQISGRAFRRIPVSIV